MIMSGNEVRKRNVFRRWRKVGRSCRSGQWRRQDFVTGGGSEVWVYWGSRVRSPPEADTFTAVHGEFVGFGTV